MASTSQGKYPVVSCVPQTVFNRLELTRKIFICITATVRSKLTSSSRVQQQYVYYDDTRRNPLTRGFLLCASLPFSHLTGCRPGQAPRQHYDSNCHEARRNEDDWTQDVRFDFRRSQRRGCVRYAVCLFFFFCSLFPSPRFCSSAPD